MSAHPPLRLRKLAPTAQHAASAGTQRSRSAGERTPKSLSWPCASARSRVSVSVSPCSNRNSTCTCSARNKRPTHCTSHQGQAGRHGHGTAAQTQPTARLPGRPAGRACGGAPFGPVTCVALVRPSSPDSMKNSTCSPSARLRKPSVMMLVCGPRWLLSGPCGCRPAAAWALYRHALPPWGATGRADRMRGRARTHLVHKQVLATVVRGDEPVRPTGLVPRRLQNTSRAARRRARHAAPAASTTGSALTRSPLWS